jgi:CelD/BcsL family acetyltransferase involved in cellulose biosynthesis
VLNAASPADDPLYCRVIEDLQGWQSVRADWDKLLDLSPGCTPWQSWDFLTYWWRHLSTGLRLRIFVVERAGRPCLILPLQISTWSWLPGLPVHMLEPIGSIMDVNRPRIALGRPDRAAYECAFQEIWRRRQEWHLARIDEKSADDDELPMLRQFAVDRHLMFRQSFSHLCPYLDLRQSWETHLNDLGSKLRKNLRASRRRLEALGKVSLNTYETVPDVAIGLGIVFDLHSRSWKLKKKIEHSKSTAYRDFYRCWLESQAQRNQTRILVLRCGDRPVAATIAFMRGTTYYSAQIVHDAEFGHCSPGTLLESMELEGLMREQRFEKYDFLGSFLNNKMRWTQTAIPTNHVFVMRKLLRNLIIDAYYFRLKPWIKPRLLSLMARLKRPS